MPVKTNFHNIGNRFLRHGTLVINNQQQVLSRSEKECMHAFLFIKALSEIVIMTIQVVTLCLPLLHRTQTERELTTGCGNQVLLMRESSPTGVTAYSHLPPVYIPCNHIL